MVQVSKPCSANHSIAEECGRPGTCRSNVGCEAIDEPCTKRRVPRRGAVAALCQRKRRTSPSAVFLVVQCSCPFMGEVYQADSVQESARERRSPPGGGPWPKTSGRSTRFP